MTNKIRLFDVLVKNRDDKFGKGATKIFEMKSCKFTSLKELVLKIATQCDENEDDDFISLTIKQVKNNGK